MSDLAMRLDTMRFGKFHWRLLLIGGSGYMFDAMDVAIIGFVLPVVTQQWHLTGTEAGIVAGSGAIGGILGALAAGRLGDRFGRRVVMMWALAIYALATMISALAANFDQFLVARIVAGIGTSAESVIIAPFLSEFAPVRLRGRFTGALTGFFSFGFVAAAVLGWLVVPASDAGWRIALAITALPIVLLLWWRRGLPESPRWLERQGRHGEAFAVVSAIEEECGRDPAAKPSPVAQTSAGVPQAGFAALFRGDLLRRTVVAMVLWGVMGCCYYAFMTWIPGLLVARGLTLTKSFGFTIAIYAAQAPGYFSAAWANDVIGRRMVIVVYLALAAVGALVLANVGTPAGLLWASMALSFALNGTYAGLYSYTPELFPTALRATGQGLATAISRGGAMVSPIMVGALYPAVGFTGVFLAALCLLAVGAFVALVAGPVTDGVSLD